jgi:lysophospholipid acyltransferase (LPLAT)-like uncharacterized protein
MRNLIRHPAVQDGLARLSGAFLAFITRTNRWDVLNPEPALAEIAAGRPLIIAFWHERLPMMPALIRLAVSHGVNMGRVVPHVLVSQHRDGRFIGTAVRRFGVEMVYGSSRRGGGAAMIEMMRVLRSGNPVVITPDGPRGPRRGLAPGVAQLAALSGAKILPVGAATTLHRRLPSWDRMMVPLPFGRGTVYCGDLISVPRDGALEALPGIATALDDACAAADAAVGIPA